MDIILYFFRDNISGIHYFIYVFILLLLMFAIIGYLFKQKYAKLEIKLNTSQAKGETIQKTNSLTNNKKLTRKEKKALKKQKQDSVTNNQIKESKGVAANNPQPIPTTPIKTATNVNQGINQSQPLPTSQGEAIKTNVIVNTKTPTQAINVNQQPMNVLRNEITNSKNLQTAANIQTQNIQPSQNTQSPQIQPSKNVISEPIPEIKNNN